MRFIAPFAASLLSISGSAFFACSDYNKDTERDSRSDSSSSSSSHKSGTHAESIDAQAASAISDFKSTDSSIQKFFESSAGYAVFPEITKGGAGIGAAHGNGVLYQHGSIVADAEVSQGSVGLQLGGQTYREIIFFKDGAALDHFKAGHTEFAANASAVAASAGAASSADYHEGVAVFTMTNGGLMFEAAIGGQKFSYRAR